jgi:hypothetical protein
MKITRSQLRQIIKEEISEVLQTAGGVWVIEKTGVGADERYLHPRNRWGPLWNPEIPDVVGALVFGDKAEAMAYLRQNDISTDNRPYPSFYSDDDLDAMEMSAEEPPARSRAAALVDRMRRRQAKEEPPPDPHDEETLHLSGDPSQREIDRLAYGARTGRWRK